MRRRHLLLAALTLPVLLLAAGVLWLLNQDPDRYRAELATLLAEASGYPVTLSGPLALRWRPTPTLTAAQVQVQVPGAGVSLGTVQVTVDPQALLARRFRARQVIVQDLRVDLLGEEPASAPAALPDPRALAVDELDIHGATLLRNGRPLLALTSVQVRQPQDPAGAQVDLRGSVGGAELRARVRVRVDGALVGLDVRELHTPAGTVEGRLSLRLDGERPLLSGEVGANALAFVPAGDRVGRDRLIARVPVDLSLLSALDAELRLRVGRLSVAGLRVSELGAPLTLRDGRAQMRLSGVLATGALRGVLEVDRERWALELDVDAADAGDVLVMTGLTFAERGGRLGLSARLHSAGADTAALLAGLTGRVSLDASKVTLRAGAAQIAGADVFASLLRTLRGDDSNRVVVECAVARLAVSEGVLRADRSIAAQSRAMNLLGGGTVSLVDERVDLALRPWPREGLGLSATAVVGTVAITGPLSAPRAELTAEAALRGGATAGAALMTGGLSLIAQGLLERARGDTPCQDVAGRKEGAGRAAPASVTSPAGALGEAAEGIGRTIRGLFGGGTGPGAGRGGQADR